MVDYVEYTQFPIAMNVKKRKKEKEKGFVKNNVPYFYSPNYQARVHSVKV